MESLSERLKKFGLDSDKCYQCGTCTGDCPVAQIDSRFNPRKIVLATTQNSESVDSLPVWLCATCYKCYRCPRDVNPAEILSVVRKLSVKKGNTPKVTKSFAQLVKKYGELPEIRLAMEVKGIKAINTTPFSVVMEMLKKGKINFIPKKSPGADEVKKIFEIAGDADE
ncbi:MAG: 4Fe-4S dicluster domain-containing protein [Archaeoglobaceae archaeon]